MSTKGMTTMEVKKINKSKVYKCIYQNRKVSKQEIAGHLLMGLSTVTQNLKLLEQEGLITRNGFYESTGGRKAFAIEIKKNARISIGVDILKEMIHLAAVNLYGEILFSKTITLPFANTPAYCMRVGTNILDFIAENHLPGKQVLGVSIAIQGIISTDGQSVSYGVILNHTGMKLQDFAVHIPYPCRLIHDSKAAAYLELWQQDSKRDATVLLLNRNLGGAVLLNGKVHNGRGMHSGAIEHLCLDPEGPLCYCGKKGCLETYCSAESLQKASGLDTVSFFRSLRLGNPVCRNIWEGYLDHLAFAIRNLTTLLDQIVILSGYLASFFTREDIDYLTRRVTGASPFPMEEPFLFLSGHGQMAPAVGAALSYIDDFLKSI